MKKLALFASFLFVAGSANAQYPVGTLSVQPKVGFTAAALTNTPDLHIEGLANTLKKTPNVGTYVGVELEYQATPWLGLTAALSYKEQGCAWEDFDYTIDDREYDAISQMFPSYDLGYNHVNVRGYNYQIELGYLNLPLIANFYVWKGLALKAGVQVGLLTNAHFMESAKADTKVGDTKVYGNLDIRRNMRKDCNKLDIAIPVGLSYEFKRHIVLDARYDIGLLKLIKEEDPLAPEHNRVFQMSIGYKFKIKK